MVSAIARASCAVVEESSALGVVFDEDARVVPSSTMSSVAGRQVASGGGQVGFGGHGHRRAERRPEGDDRARSGAETVPTHPDVFGVGTLLLWCSVGMTTAAATASRMMIVPTRNTRPRVRSRISRAATSATSLRSSAEQRHRRNAARWSSSASEMVRLGADGHTAAR